MDRPFFSFSSLNDFPFPSQRWRRWFPRKEGVITEGKGFSLLYGLSFLLFSFLPEKIGGVREVVKARLAGRGMM
jgi:hypothetical protein